MKHRKKCRECQWQRLQDERRVANWLMGIMDGQFQYRWRQQDRRGRALENMDDSRFRYIHPEQWRRWLKDGPCRGCPCEPYCDEICALRARWWDDRMERVRRSAKG